MSSLTIGQVAEQSGVGVETVRFYEREGVLEKPKRSASGYRQFDQDVVDRIRFVKRAKELGFTLKEVKELLSLRVDPKTTCEEVRRHAEAKIEDIEAKIQSLRRMKRALVKLAKECSNTEAITECPILEALDGKCC